MPPDWWMVEVGPTPETFGSRIRALRKSRGWSQRDIARRTNIEQTEISKFELDRYMNRKDEVVAAFEDAYELTRGSLRHLPWGSALKRQTIPGPGYAIPNDPELIEAVNALYLLEREQLPQATETIRRLVILDERARPAPKRQERDEGAS